MRFYYGKSKESFRGKCSKALFFIFMDGLYSDLCFFLIFTPNIRARMRLSPFGEFMTTIFIRSAPFSNITGFSPITLYEPCRIKFYTGAVIFLKSSTAAAKLFASVSAASALFALIQTTVSEGKSSPTAA